MLDSTRQVAFAAEAVKGLRYAPMNSANHKTVRFALDCLPRCGSRVYRAAFAAQNHWFLILTQLLAEVEG